MQRPNTILGLVTHLAKMKWQALSPNGRKVAMVLAVVLGASSALAVRAATCDGACCGSDCAPAQVAEGGPCAGPCAR